MKNKKLIAILSVFMCILCVIGIGVGVTIAKYKTSTSGSLSTQLHDFNVTFEFKYTDDETGTEQTITASDLQNSNGLLRLSLTEYDTLKVNTIYYGMGKCYYRFRIKESWQHLHDGVTEMITPKQLSDYTLADGLYDNRSDDGFIYSGVLTGESDSSVQTFNVITSCTKGLDAADLLDEADVSTFVDIMFEIDAVQWNRAKVMWRLSNEQWARINGYT